MKIIECHIIYFTSGYLRTIFVQRGSAITLVARCVIYRHRNGVCHQRKYFWFKWQKRQAILGMIYNELLLMFMSYFSDSNNCLGNEVINHLRTVSSTSLHHTAIDTVYGLFKLWLIIPKDWWPQPPKLLKECRKFENVTVIITPVRGFIVLGGLPKRIFVSYHFRGWKFHSSSLGIICL